MGGAVNHTQSSPCYGGNYDLLGNWPMDWMFANVLREIRLDNWKEEDLGERHVVLISFCYSIKLHNRA